MAFPLKDVRVTTRRPANAADDILPILYPRLLRDAAFLPKIGIAINYFESMVGKPRREFDPELLVQFFGDHKLARSIVVSLARRYRFHTPPLKHVITPGALLRLRRAGLDHPRLLRLELYDRANADGPGFLSPPEQLPMHEKIERQLRLRRGELDRLLHLDAAENAMLVRVGPGQPPEPREVMAYYNFDALDTLIRRAEQIDLALAGLTDDDLEVIRGICSEEAVQVEVKTGARATLIRLRGRQDSMGLWSRHGRRVSRCLLHLIHRYRPHILDGGALIALKHKRALLKLTPELLDALLMEELLPTPPVADAAAAA